MKVNVRSKEAYDLMHNGTLAFSRAEQHGIMVDMEYVKRRKEWIIDKIASLEADFKRTNFYKRWEHVSGGRVNVGSGPQLAHYLYDVLKIPPAKLTVTGRGSTDEEALRQLDIPELNLLLDRVRYKKAWDVLNGFETEQVDGIVRTFFNLSHARTYRSSSDSPNFQNIPKRDEEIMKICRKAIVPRPGFQFVEVDFSGLEVRIAACYHKDPNMLRYLNDSSSDMHGDMAMQIFMLDKFDKSNADYGVLRQAAKNGFVFAQFYGSYYKNCAVNLACNWGKLPQGAWRKGQGIPFNGGTLGDHLIANGMRSIEDFTDHIQEVEKSFWEDRFPDYAAWKDRWWAAYQKNGYIDMLTGFRCSGVMKKTDCTNYPIQGSAFHCNLWSFIELDRFLQYEEAQTHLVGQIHDSMILEVHPSEFHTVIEQARHITGKALPDAWKWIIVPLNVDVEVAPVNKSWADKEKYK